MLLPRDEWNGQREKSAKVSPYDLARFVYLRHIYGKDKLLEAPDDGEIYFAETLTEEEEEEQERDQNLDYLALWP